MNTLLEKASRRPALLIAAIIALTAVFLVAMGKNAVLETDLDAYMPSTHPAFVFSDEAEELFGIEDAVLFAVEHPESIYNRESLEKIALMTEALSERFEEIEAGDITSLYTAENITSSEWGLEVEPFYTDAPESPEELAAVRRSVEENEMIYGRIVSRDGTAALIIAEISSDAFDGNFYEELKAFAREWEGPETIHVAGRPVVEGELGKLGPRDMARMAPLVIIVMFFLLLLLLRSLRDTIINMIIVAFGTLAAFGAMALTGVPVYSVDTMIPVMLIAIGVAYGIHMHNSIHHLVREFPGISRDDLIRRSLGAMVRPVSMAAITTAVGFSSLMTSQVLPVRYFGLFASLGVMTEMALALLLFPASIRILGPPKVQEGKETSGKKKTEWGKGMLSHPGKVVAAALIITGFAAAGASRVWIDTSFLANFEKSSDIVRTDRFVNDHFGGTSTLNVIFSSDRPDTFKQPEVLRLMDEVQRDIERNALVGESFSIADYMKRMNKVMNGDDPAFDVIPETSDMIAQYLLLYEMSGDPDNLNRIVDYDYAYGNLTFQLKSDSSALLGDLIETIDGYGDDFAAQGVRIQYAGSGYKALIFADLLLEGQIISLLLSFGIVALLLTLLFKSVLIGIAGTIPIAITAVVNFGTMGLLGIPLSSATALISSIAIGIGVDYAIHLIEHYRTCRRDGMETGEAASETLRNTGRAIIYNAAAVMGGFSVLMISVFPPNRQVGGLIALNMATSAIGTLTLLLVVIVALDRKGRILK